MSHGNAAPCGAAERCGLASVAVRIIVSGCDPEDAAVAEANNKIQASAASVEAFLAAVPDARRREDARALDALMQSVVGTAPTMWGPAIVGYGRFRLRYDGGREQDWMLVGFSPRKAALVLYVTGGFDGHEALLERLGRHTTGTSCLYVKRMEDIDMDVLRELVERSVRHVRERHGAG